MDEQVVPIQYILYTNHSVSVSFADGSELKLSPCSSVFLHLQPPGVGQHPLQSYASVQQRTRFVTSSYRQKVQLAVDFRNRFVDRPFLCQELIDPCNIFRYHSDIFLVSWPPCLSKCQFTIFPDGSIQLSSLEGHASICLASHRRAFTVRFLAKLSDDNLNRTERDCKNVTTLTGCKSDSRLESNSSSANPNEQSSVSDLKDSRVSKTMTKKSDKTPLVKDCFPDESKPCTEAKTSTIFNATSWDYCWTVQYHSMQGFPSDWSHPIQLLVKFAEMPNFLSAHQKAMERSREVVEDLSIETYEKNDSSAVIHTALPRTLGLKCPAPHLHKFKKEPTVDGASSREGVYSGKVKTFYMKGTVYRLFWHKQKCIEIYPEDGSIICSSGVTGQTFSHFIFTDDQVEERTYSIHYPPPVSVDFPYSIAKLVQVGARLLQVLSNEAQLSITKDDQSCYESVKSAETPEAPLTTRTIEECVVPNFGRFTAQSNGIVRVVFTDRTCLDMQIELSPHLRPTQAESQLLRSKLLCDWPAGFCRLLLPNGQYHFVNIDRPDVQYESYIRAAIDWSSWVNTPASERHSFYKDTVRDPERWNAVNLELKKIQCFSYILENSVLPKVKSSLRNRDSVLNHQEASRMSTASRSQTGDAAFNSTSINEVLRRNTEMLKSLDQFLKVNGETKPCKEQ